MKRPKNQSIYAFIDSQNLNLGIRSQGWKLDFKPTLPRADGETKGNVDAELVLHTMIEWQHYDKSIIISGDGDFRCLIQYLEKKKKLFHVLIPNPHKYSALLREYRNYFVYINGLKEKLKEDKKERE